MMDCEARDINPGWTDEGDDDASSIHTDTVDSVFPEILGSMSENTATDSCVSSEDNHEVSSVYANEGSDDDASSIYTDVVDSRVPVEILGRTFLCCKDTNTDRYLSW